jgi:ribosomal protein S1
LEPDSKTSPLRLDSLKPKTRLEGVVTKIELSGAIVDVGAEREGFVHISMLQRGPVNRVEDVLREGQAVEAWVHRVEPAAGRLELTLIRPLALEWKDLRPGLRLSGKVVRLETFGAFVDIGAERPGLLHVSEMGSGYIGQASDVLEPGEDVDVVVTDVDRKKRQIRLSTKGISPQAEEDDEQPVPTAMEVALRKALGQQKDETERPRGRERPRRPARHDLEEILSRTLRQKVRSTTGDD